jgi:hypothetical protein
MNRESKFDENGGRSASSSINSRTSRSASHRKIIDTSLLARGLTSRFIGVRVANHIKPLVPVDIEKDIRHMEGYSAACVSYSQQLFAYSNKELVTRGHYGAAPPAPGMTFTQPPQNEFGLPNVTMPVKIDPEEEKRISVLRKRVAASEAKREVLETEYVSLRAHYVHESHRLNRSRKFVSGQHELLTELVKRRSKVLALRRVRCAVARDILACLEARSSVADSVMSNTDSSVVPVPASSATEEAMTELDGNYGDVSTTATANEVPVDLIDVWATIESKLQEAELSCTDIDTPENLTYIKKALFKDATALDIAYEGNATNSNNGRRSRSPMRINGAEDDASLAKKKARADRAPSRRNSDDASVSKGKMDTDNRIIPWNCRVMPRTPYDVALYLSNLSSAPDMAAAFACDGLFGSKSESLSWLEANLPAQAVPGSQSDSEKLEEMKKELEVLQNEMKAEIDLNSKIQSDIIEGKKRSDELTAMMIMLRTETEAVIQRHNQILESKSRASHGEMKGDNDDEGSDGNYETQEYHEMSNVDNEGGVSDEEATSPVREVIVPSRNGAEKRGFNGSKEGSDPERKRRRT